MSSYDDKMRELAYDRFSNLSSKPGKLMDAAYTLARLHEPFTTAEVLALAKNESLRKYSSGKTFVSSDRNWYARLKATMRELTELLEWKVGKGCFPKKPDPDDSRKTIYEYVGDIDDPLAEEIYYSHKMALEDYIAFCKSSEGFFPDSWFTHFFSRTLNLRDKENRDKAGEQHLKSSANSMLKNIDLLPALFEAIHKHQVLKVRERPFVQPECDVLFHPQYLKEFNGRWFAFGYGIKDGTEVIPTFNLPLDRIVEMNITDEVEYIAAEPGFWDKHFENIIGVTHGYYDGKTRIEQGVQTIVIRTHSINCHGRITTKTFHASQKETKPYGQHQDDEYGEITLVVEPNNELVGRILQMGTDLEVIKPVELRNKIKHDLQTLSERYK